MKNNDTKKLLKYAGVLISVFIIITLLINFEILNGYVSQVLIVIGINIILAVSLNLVIGFTGQLALGHAGFMSIGGYAAAIISLKLNAPFIVALLLGGLVAALLGYLIGLPILRLKGDYLAITTLGFGEIIRVVIINLDVLGGPRGLQVPLKTDFTWVYFAVIFAVIVIKNIINSSQGRAMIAIREDEIAAEAMGINTTKFKVRAFVIAAFFAGIAGGLYAHFYMFMDPGSFNFLRSFEILTYVVLGGMGSLSGSIIAAAVLTALSEILRNFNDYRMVVYALSLVLLMIFRPQGIMGNKELSLKIFGDIEKKLFKSRGDKNGASECK